MRGLRIPYAKRKAERALRPDLSGLLRTAGGLNPPQSGIRHGDDDGDHAAGKAPATGADSGSGERVVTCCWPYRELSPNARVHWAVKARAKRAYRTECWALALHAKLAPIDWDGTIYLHMTFMPQVKRRRDGDNLIASFKAGFDGIADALGVDDSRFCVLPPVISDETGGHVVVRISQEPPTC